MNKQAEQCPKPLSAEELARDFHDCYEKISKCNGWDTQISCQSSFDDLPDANKRTMIDTCEQVLIYHIQPCIAARDARIAELERAVEDSRYLLAGILRGEMSLLRISRVRRKCEEALKGEAKNAEQ